MIRYCRYILIKQISMATSGKSNEPLSEEEMNAISKAFQDMGVKPKATSAEEFQKMDAFICERRKVKT